MFSFRNQQHLHNFRICFLCENFHFLRFDINRVADARPKASYCSFESSISALACVGTDGFQSDGRSDGTDMSRLCFK